MNKYNLRSVYKPTDKSEPVTIDWRYDSEKAILTASLGREHLYTQGDIMNDSYYPLQKELNRTLAYDLGKRAKDLQMFFLHDIVIQVNKINKS